MRPLLPPDADQLRALLAAALHESEMLRYLHRLHAVLLVSVGRSCYDVAHWFGDNPRSVERWVHAFDAAGDRGLHDHHRGGRKARLALQQIDVLALDLTQAPSILGYAHPRWSAKLVAHHVQLRFGVTLSPRQCLRLQQVHRAHGTSR